MASRHRLGVALLLDAPVADEVDGLRRGLGDRALGRIAAHITLVPPVNVRAADLPAALETVRRAAHTCGRPLELTLGPPDSFLPANPVVLLAVGGDLAPLSRLRDDVFAGPLHRSLSWPWVPHVTLADDADPAGIEPALHALRHYRVPVSIDRVVVLEERRGPAGRRWEPFADAALAPAALVGRGGLDLVLVRGRVIDPAAAALIHEAGYPWSPVAAESLPDAFDGGGASSGASLEVSGGASSVGGASSRGGEPIVVTGVVAGDLVGVAVVWRTDGGGRIVVAVTPGRRGSGMGRQLLVHAEAAVRAAGWDCPILEAPGPAGFYAACSRWSVVA